MNAVPPHYVPPPSVLGEIERNAKRRQASEFSFGPGLVAPELASNDPAYGGRYRARAASENPAPAKVAMVRSPAVNWRYPVRLWPDY